MVEDDLPTQFTIEDLTAAARRQTVDEFVRMLDQYVFIGPPAARMQTGDPEAWSYSTASLTLEIADADGEVIGFHESLVHPIRKKSSGPFSETILIGRATSNDVCIPDDRLSKLHARIHKKDDGSMLLTEAGSKNGTKHNGRSLGPRDMPVLKHGDEVSLGGLTLTVYSAKTLYGLLQRLRRKARSAD